jgi:hypothetical protein
MYLTKFIDMNGGSSGKLLFMEGACLLGFMFFIMGIFQLVQFSIISKNEEEKKKNKNWWVWWIISTILFCIVAFFLSNM